MHRFGSFSFVGFVLACGACNGSSSSSAPNDGGSDADPFAFAAAPTSCAFACDCADGPGHAYQCPSLGDWTKVPHDSACPTWD
jgi:hypothetical protein